MIRSTRRWSRQALATTLLAAAVAAPAFAAEDNAATAPAAPADAQAQQQQAPQPNPAAEKALNQRFQSVFAAFEGKAALPEAKHFTEDFNKQVSAEQMKEVLQQVHQSVGACKIAAQMRSPVSFASGFLLQCEKAFVPMDIAVEDKAPYRIHSLLIRPGYWKK
ncbi:hypothetical protein [Comamonas sp. GB3 AK4-5]|uniref:hypothetical protein n=1 Tax=Comamonas sp. GB3 AK4-5 TaxID=3231487 RepID=UPI00351E8953